MPRQHGYALYEALIGIFLFTLILTSVGGRSARYTQAARGAAYYQFAAFKAENMADYISAHSQRSGDYEQQWRHEVELSLPGSKAEVSENGKNDQIVVRWGGYREMCQENKMGISGCVKTQCVVDRQ